GKLQPELTRSQKEWEPSLTASAPIPWGPVRGLVAHYRFDGDLSAQVSISDDGKPNELAVLNGEPQFMPGRVGQALSFDRKRFIQGGDIVGLGYHTFVGLPRVGDDRRTVSYDDPYTLAAWIYPTSGSGPILTKATDAAAPDDIGHALVLKDGKIQYNN